MIRISNHGTGKMGKKSVKIYGAHMVRVSKATVHLNQFGHGFGLAIMSLLLYLYKPWVGSLWHQISPSLSMSFHKYLP